MSLAEKHTVHVDEYVDLHPDLFEIPGRGTYLGGNPGAPILAAIPYALFLPAVNHFAPVRPPQTSPGGSGESRDWRQSHFVYYKFLEKVRARGLDRHIGAAVAITSCFFMAPLTALSAVVMFWLFLRLRFATGYALGMTVLYAFGTPVFFRTATLSLNLVVGLLGIFSFALLWWPEDQPPSFGRLRYFAAGFVAGWALLTDYSGVVTVSLLGLFALALQLREKRFWPALRESLWYFAGALGPVLFLLFWQWYCYGNTWLPAQFHMPKTYYMGYQTDRGFGWPMPTALWTLLFDPLYGLLVFCPILTFALFHLLLLRRRSNKVPGRVAAFCWAFFIALLIFCSCIEYTLRFQWRDGVRYMIPAVPFLFLLVADSLRKLPKPLVYSVAVFSIVETWCLAMVRENLWGSITQVFTHGPELPWHTSLIKSVARGFPGLSGSLIPAVVLLAGGIAVWGIWWIGRRRPAIA